GKTRQHHFEKSLEILATDLIPELQGLNTRLRQELAPIPRLQLAQRQVSEDHLVAEECEQRARRVGLEVTDLLIRDVERALARGMAVAVQRHRGERLGKGVEETGRIAAHRLGTAALRMSGSLDAAANA